MGSSGRYYMGILFALLAIAGGYALLHAGVYGCMIFVVPPVFLSGLATPEQIWKNLMSFSELPCAVASE